MNHNPLADRLVFAVVNLLVYLRYPGFVWRFRRRGGRWANFATPHWQGELVQWRKLFDRNPIFPVFSDKLAVKEWAAEHFPGLAVPNTLWVGRRPEDIPDELIRPGVVIKTNNGTNKNYFPHRTPLDREALNALLRRWMPGLLGRWIRHSHKLEWAYWPVEPKIFVEELVGDMKRGIVDIGVRAFDGNLANVSVATDYKTADARIAFFEPDGRPIAAKWGDGGVLPPDFRLPETYSQAVELAKRISRGFDYLRVDFLTDGERVYLGEITLYPNSGYGGADFRTEATYRQWLETLERSWFLATPQPWPLRLYANAMRRWLSVHRNAPPTIPEPEPAAAPAAVA